MSTPVKFLLYTFDTVSGEQKLSLVCSDETYLINCAQGYGYTREAGFDQTKWYATYKYHGKTRHFDGTKQAETYIISKVIKGKTNMDGHKPVLPTYAHRFPGDNETYYTSTI